jgi:transposase
MLHGTVLGIDVSKDKLDCSLVDADTEKRIWFTTFANDRGGIAKLLAKTDPSVPLVAEPTGPYTLPLAKQATAANRTVLLAPPRKARDFKRSLQSRARTDDIDSFGLALFGASRQLALYPIKSNAVEHLDSLLSYRRVLSGNITRMAAQARSLPQVSARISADLAVIRKQLIDLDKEIERVTKTAPEFEAAKRLEQVPGFGPVISAALASRLVHKNFDNPDQAVAYCGLDVVIVQSGKRKGELGLSKQGDSELRRLLYCGAQATLRCKESPFKAQYEREIAKGHKHKQAICAIARKMLKLAWSLVRHGGNYDPARVYQQQ